MTFTIDRRTRESLSKGVRIYRISYGAIILILGIVIIVRKGLSLTESQAILGEGFILIGVFSIIYGLVGKKLFSQRIQIQMDAESIRVKKNFEKETLILMESISYVKVLPMKLEFSYSDYAKTIDFSYLTQEEFDQVKTIITEYCVKNSIEIE